MRKEIVFVFCFAVVLFVSGCETIKGIGRDVENTGQNIQEALTKD